MAQPIDSNSTSSNPGSPESPSVERYYRQAVEAFKAHNYSQALIYFQRLGQLPPESAYYLKALMGQVRVYQSLGQVDQAKRLCQKLLNSSSSQASQWADQVLSQLPPTEVASPPRAQQADSISASETTADIGPDLSGFVPLDQSTRLRPKSVTSQPLSPPRSADTPVQESAIVSGGKPVPGESLTPPSGSLFHFQQLNQRPGEQQPDTASFAQTEPGSQVVSANGKPETTVRPVPSGVARPRPQASLPQRPLGLWVGQGLTAIAVLWAINWAFHLTLRTVNGGLRRVRWPVQLGLPGANQSYTVWIISALVLLALASPWILDYALGYWYRQRPLSTRQLQGTNPDVLRLLRQVCRQQGWQMPELRVIPDPAPLCFSYGWLPRNTRIVVSQGLLDHCSKESITALYGYELARAVNRSLPVLSAVGLLLLLLHNSYRRFAQWGDAVTQPLGRGLAGLMANALYGLFWLLRQMVLWLSRLCSSWADRRAVALTQHPDHLSQGLLELTEAIARQFHQRGGLHPLHSSLEILMPVGYRQALTPGSIRALASDAPAFQGALMATDSLNPYRQWLRVNASHLPLGERLSWLNQQALSRGQLGLALESYPATPSMALPLLLLQKGPLAGLAAGGSLAMVLWFLGGVVNRLGWQRLSWLYQDASILTGGLWLGLGLGLLLRINLLFPDSQPRVGNSAAAQPDAIATLFQAPPLLPVQGQPVTLRGQLRGPAGAANWGCQDLYLEDASGFVRLVNPAPLGSLQGAFQPHNHPHNWIGRRVMVTGWGRYNGGMLWVDIHQIQLDGQRFFQAYGPIWATFLSLGACLLGILSIFRGG